ncbi:MAG: acyl-CoA dehydrogenase family protein [Actinomycetota bacterium]|nr:acyl-CoA dehydrogenase family protein [Actinomycetota bacterium]
MSSPQPWWPLGDSDQLGAALRHWVQVNWDTSITVGEWWQRLATAGLAAPTWDRAHGGLSATTRVQQMIEEELATVGAIAPPTVHAAVRLVGPALRQFATEVQVQALMPALLCGRERWTVLMSEPDAPRPDDTTCRAEFDWKLITVEGTKCCTDPTADRALVLTRSSGMGREGLTWLFLDLAHGAAVPGDGVLHLQRMQLTRERVLGEKDHGWEIAKVLLPYTQRSLAGRIRRGLVHVQPGSSAGNLERTVAEVLAANASTRPPQQDRRAR